MEYGYKKDISIIAEFYTVVCGGGCAGFTAAIQSARIGVSTCIIEKNNMLGGIMTAGGNNEIALFYAGDRQIIKGIGWEFVLRLNKEGFSDIPKFDKSIHHSQQGVKVNIVMAGELLDRMCFESGVELFFLCTIVDVIKEGEDWLVIVASKGGLFGIRAKVIIDCSGDGDVCSLAGAKYEVGDENGKLQPGTLRFFTGGYKLENIDEKQSVKSIKEHLRTGELKKNDFWPCENDAFIIFDHNGNNINHIEVDKNYEKNRSNIEIRGRQSVARTVKWARKYVLGAENFEAVFSSSEVALRETRRIICDEYISANDYIAARVYEDSICYAYYPIDLHTSSEKSLVNIFLEDGKIPTIPFGAMLPKGLDNIIVAGRCISGDRMAQSAYRVKAACMAMGQVAGAAAAIAIKGKTKVRDVCFLTLKQTLVKYDAILPNE